jgi:hypothetical protein
VGVAGRAANILWLCCVLAVACDSSAPPREAAESNSDAATAEPPQMAHDAGAMMTGCPSIACRSGVDIDAPLAVPFSEAIASQVEVCRNDECYSGTWMPMADPGAGGGAIFHVPDFGDHPELRDRMMAPVVDVILISRQDANPTLQVTWNPWSDSDLHGGDRYRVTVTNAGRTLLEVDQRVDAYDTGSPLPAKCKLMCMHKTIELDEKGRCVNCEGDADAGDDAGGS